MAVLVCTSTAVSAVKFIDGSWDEGLSQCSLICISLLAKDIECFLKNNIMSFAEKVMEQEKKIILSEVT